MRRLPVYLLLDCSGSMYGEPIEAVKNGMQLLMSTLQSDPYAMETAYLSVITFETHAKQVIPLTEIAQLQLPEIKAGGCTALGEALSLLAECAAKEVQKTTREVKGDWKPMVFILTDGQPTDDLQAGIRDMQKGKWGTIVACAAGNAADTDTLKQITENIVALDTADSAAIKAFLKWVSASVSTTSQSVNATGNDSNGLSELPPPPEEVNIVI